MSEADWRPIEALLDRFALADRQVRFWLRDDDAIAPTPLLDRLMSLCEDYKVPLLLAVIPEPVSQALAQRIANCPLVQPCQHGFNHHNYADEGARACELGADRPPDEVVGDLSQGRMHLEALFGSSLRSILVPPWNRIDVGLLRHLPQLGFRAISTFGRGSLAAMPSLIEINTQLDIMNWRQGRIGRDHADLLRKLAAELDIAFTSNQPIGVLGHHLVHDETAWKFLEMLFAKTCRHSAVRWVSVDELM